MMNPGWFQVPGSSTQLQARRLERLNSRTREDGYASEPSSPRLIGGIRLFVRRPIVKPCWREYADFIVMCSVLTLCIIFYIVYNYITTRPEMPRYEFRDVTFSEFSLHTSLKTSRSGQTRTSMVTTRQFEFGLEQLNILAINPTNMGRSGIIDPQSILIMKALS